MLPKMTITRVSNNVLIFSVVFKFIKFRDYWSFGKYYSHHLYNSLVKKNTATSYLMGNWALADLLVRLTFYPLWIIEVILTILNIDSGQYLFCKLQN